VKIVIDLYLSDMETFMSSLCCMMSLYHLFPRVHIGTLMMSTVTVSSNNGHSCTDCDFGHSGFSAVIQHLVFM